SWPYATCAALSVLPFVFSCRHLRQPLAYKLYELVGPHPLGQVVGKPLGSVSKQYAQFRPFLLQLLNHPTDLALPVAIGHEVTFCHRLEITAIEVSALAVL